MESLVQQIATGVLAEKVEKYCFGEKGTCGCLEVQFRDPKACIFLFSAGWSEKTPGGS